MRLLIFPNSFLPTVGGMEYVIHYLAEALVSLGVDVTVMPVRRWTASNFPHSYRLIRYGVPFRGSYRLRISHIAAYWDLYRLHRRWPIDIANIHGVSYAPQLSLGFFKSHRIPVVMTPHGEDIQKIPEIGYGIRLDKKWDRVIRNNLKLADVITAISDSVRQSIEGIEQDRIADIPNGIHRGLFGTGESTYLKDLLSLAPDTKIILSVGRNHIKKGYRYGIAAIKELVGKYHMENVHYVLIGSQTSELAALVKSECMLERVTLLEALPPESLRHCYNSADIFFSPSIVEGLSLVSIEAMACGLPLLVTDVPGNKDIVRDNECGLIVRSKDPMDMARGLYELLTSPDISARFSQIALERSANYDWQCIARQYLDVYEEVIRNRRGRLE